MKYIIIYLEIEHMLHFLSQEEKGDFLDLMIVYAKNQEEPIVENKSVLNVFNFIRERLDTQIEKSLLKAEVARKNGLKGGRGNNKPKPKVTQLQPKKTQWVKPTVSDVSDYCNEILANIDPQSFFDYYESNGWKVGKNAMKDWKATVRQWKSRDNKPKPLGSSYSSKTDHNTQILQQFVNGGNDE